MKENERKKILIDKIISRLNEYKSLQLLEKIYQILTNEN